MEIDTEVKQVAKIAQSIGANKAKRDAVVNQVIIKSQNLFIIYFKIFC